MTAGPMQLDPVHISLGVAQAAVRVIYVSRAQSVHLHSEPMFSVIVPRVP